MNYLKIYNNLYVDSNLIFNPDNIENPENVQARRGKTKIEHSKKTQNLTSKKLPENINARIFS